MNHMKSTHKQVEQDSSTASKGEVHPNTHTDTGTITKALSKIESFFTEDFMNPSTDPLPS
jgi:hypothetical protein